MVLGYSGISWTICKQSAPRSRQITTPTTHHSILLFLIPNQQCESTEGQRTHTHQFNDPLSGTTRVSQYQQGKTNLILLKQDTVSGSGISWAVCKSAPRSRQITTPAPHQSVYYRSDALPAAQPTARKHWRQSKALKDKEVNTLSYGDKFNSHRCWKQMKKGWGHKEHVARAYNGGMGQEPSVRSRGEPPVGARKQRSSSERPTDIGSDAYGNIYSRNLTLCCVTIICWLYWPATP